MEWYERAYPGGRMVGPPWPRSLYPPDSGKGSKDGPDVEAAKICISRGGRWPWQTFDRVYSNGFAHGTSGNVGESGVEGFQRQMKIQPTGYIGKQTANTIRSARIPEGLPHAGEPLMNDRAIALINQAIKQFGAGAPDNDTDDISFLSRQAALNHMSIRVGYTESPPHSNSDRRPDGIRKSQTVTAAGGSWLHNQPWCGCWCFYALQTAKVRGIDSSLASVAQIEDNARKKAKCFKDWVTDGRRATAGDLVVVGGYGVHVEMLRGPVSSGEVPTYGGNTSPGRNGSQSNGGGAYRRVRTPREVRGFALVRYPGE